MKRVVFTLGAVSVVCACGLVIDPDKLVEGNGTPIDTPNEGGPDSNGGGGTDAASDVSTDGPPVVDVPECVPPLPSTTGAQGPYAVVSADANGPAPTCPPGYLPTAVAEGKTSLSAPAAECNSTVGCSCGSGTGSAKCGLRARYFDDATCTKASNRNPTSFTMCTDLENEDYLQVEYNVTGVTCPPSGSATPTAKPTPTWRTQYVVCAPDPSVKTAVCKGGDIPLPQAKNADACIVVPSNANCFAGDYNGTIPLSKSGTFTDNRTCACGCVGAQSNCTGGAASANTFIFCMGTATSLNVGECVKRDNKEFIQSTTAPSATGSPTCTTRAAPGGEVTPSYDTKLCCLKSGSN